MPPDLFSRRFVQQDFRQTHQRQQVFVGLESSRSVVSRKATRIFRLAAARPGGRLPLRGISGKEFPDQEGKERSALSFFSMPKSNRSGQAAILDGEQLDSVMELLRPECRAVLSCCRYTAARISEALHLKWENVSPGFLLIPKRHTKKQMATREIPMHPRLWEELEAWRSRLEASPSKGDWLFPSQKDPSKPFPRRTVDAQLRIACKKLGLDGVSTHSFRRSALTAASSKGVPLRVIQAISGHSSLDILQRYLSVSEAQKKQAALAFD